MTEEELKKKEDDLMLKEKALNDAIKAYMIARIDEEEAKEKYDEWVRRMQKTNFIVGISFGISITILVYNIVALF